MTITIALIVLVALSFDFFNGFHDAANSIATVVSTRVLTPRQAVAWAAFFNFAAFLIFGTKVADTISNVVHPGTLTNAGIFAALVGAILWVVLSAHAAIALGTLLGGWRIVHTMGSKITKLQPVGGMCAESAAASAIWGVTLAGIPVSTTHTIAGAIVGVGTTQRLSAVRWGVAGRVVWAWVLTIPGAFVMAWLAYLPFRGLVR